MNSGVVLALCFLPFIVTGQKPSFCGTNDCPSFTTPETQYAANGDYLYEVRRYEPSDWVVTPGLGGGAFWRLFRYIRGANSQGQAIDMTVPVLKAKRASGVTMMFYLAVPNPPAPTGSNVELFSFPQKSFYVRAFNTTEQPGVVRYNNELQSLKDAINNPALYDTTVSYTAGYHSPYYSGVRHNEVWLEKL